MKTKTLPLDQIRQDTRLQTRAGVNMETVEEYSTLMRGGAEFPPVDVYQVEGGDYLLADGWHRVEAAKRAGLESIRCQVFSGGREGAILHAVTANKTHGLQRTNADKRRCVALALEYYAIRSSREIAELCGVSNHMVDNMRAQLGESPSSPRTGRDGKTRRMPAKAPSAPANDPEFPDGCQGPAEAEDAEDAPESTTAPSGNLFSGPGEMRTADEEQGLDSSSGVMDVVTGLGSDPSSSTDDLPAADAAFSPEDEASIWLALMAACNLADKYGAAGRGYLLGILPKAEARCRKEQA